MSNLRFTKVFVVDPVASNWIVTGKPTDLTVNQLGFFQVDQQGVTVGGATATPAPATVRRAKFAQNLGDSSYGTVKSQIINVDDVVGYFGKTAAGLTTQITYLGYDELDTTKDLGANCSKEIIIPFTIYDKKLARWYNPVGFHRRLVIDTSCCPDCGSPCTAADKLALGQAIVDQVNNGLQRAGDFIVGNELGQYLTATLVQTGTGATLRVGVKLETKAISEDAQSSLNAADPIKMFEFQTVYFTVGSTFNGICDGTNIPITTPQNATAGSGWAAGLAALEAESQGFDRVRDMVTSYPHSALNGFKILAAAGKTYDYIHLNYKFKHRTGNGVENAIDEPYEVIIAFPTGTGGVITTALNSWLSGKFPSVTL